MTILAAPRRVLNNRREAAKINQPDLPRSLQPSRAARTVGIIVLIIALVYFIAPII